MLQLLQHATPSRRHRRLLNHHHAPGFVLEIGVRGQQAAQTVTTADRMTKTLFLMLACLPLFGMFCCS